MPVLRLKHHGFINISGDTKAENVHDGRRESLSERIFRQTSNAYINFYGIGNTQRLLVVFAEGDDNQSSLIPQRATETT